MGALLIYRKAKEWVRSDDYAKIKILLSEVNKSITSNSQKTLKLQLSLLSQIAYHEG